jgi:hypothetical protein
MPLLFAGFLTICCHVTVVLGHRSSCGQEAAGVRAMTELAFDRHERVMGGGGPSTGAVERPRRQEPVIVDPIRISLSFEGLYQRGRYCETVGQNVSILTQVGQYVQCTAADILTESRRWYLQYKVVPGAVRRIQEFLGLYVPLNTSIRIPSAGCADFYVPPQHKTAGISNADVVLYVASVPTVRADILAFAGACLLFTDDRPAAGGLNFHPKFLDEGTESYREMMVDTATHEILHALGFIDTTFKRRKIIRTAMIAGVNRSIFNGPEAIAAARQQTGCSTLVGPELNRDDLAHWSRKGWDTELMTPGGGTRLTMLTAAAMVDLGVGYAKNTFATYESMEWSKDVGCGPFTHSCNTTEGGAGSTFCFDDTSTAVDCSWDYTGFGLCGVSNGSVPINTTAFRYFPSKPYLGGDPSLDYCPRFEPFGNRFCTDASQSTNALDGSFFGATSRCFKATNLYLTTDPKGLSWKSIGPRCLRAACGGSGSNLVVFVGVGKSSELRLCPVGDVITNFTGYNGSVTCPENNATLLRLCASLSPTTLPPSITFATSSAECHAQTFAVFVTAVMLSAVLLLSS